MYILCIGAYEGSETKVENDGKKIILPVERISVDELLAELDSPLRVTEPVERRRPESDAHDVGDHQHQGARDSGHGGEATLLDEILIE